MNKLYIWRGFEPDYTDGLAVAIAETEEHAKQLIIDEEGCIYVWGTLEVHDIKPYGVCVCGGG